MADFDKSTFDPKAAAEARKKEMDQMAEKLEAGVKDVFQGENYKAYLDFCAKMPRYSVNNQILIMMQKPDATMCQSFTGWKEMGRFVKKGEKGIRVMAPAPYKMEREQDKIGTVRDDIIRKNPTDGVKKEISKKSGKNRGIRKALTMEQQRIFMEYIAGHPIYYHWWPLFTVLLGTGCRIGEAIALRWDDLDFENRVISVNHALVYYRSSDRKQQLMRVSLPKTEAGIRTVPMLDVVKTAFEMEREQQLDMLGGLNEQVIDGMTGFVFQNREGRVPNPQTVNQGIRRITENYNSDELLGAKKEKREPVLLPHFSCHHLRHTFATRLCEAESNLKVIQSVMGHRNIETTMDIYAEATEERKQESFESLALKLDNLF